MAKRTAREALQNAKIALEKAEALKVKAIADIEKAKASISRYETAYILEMMRAQNMSLEQLSVLIKGNSFGAVSEPESDLESELKKVSESDTEEEE